MRQFFHVSVRVIFERHGLPVNHHEGDASATAINDTAPGAALLHGQLQHHH